MTTPLAVVVEHPTVRAARVRALRSIINEAVVRALANHPGRLTLGEVAEAMEGEAGEWVALACGEPPDGGWD